MHGHHFIQFSRFKNCHNIWKFNFESHYTLMSHETIIFKKLPPQDTKNKQSTLPRKETKEKAGQDGGMWGLGEVRARAKIQHINDFILCKARLKTSEFAPTRVCSLTLLRDFWSLPKSSCATILLTAFISIQSQISPLVNFSKRPWGMQDLHIYKCATTDCSTGLYSRQLWKSTCNERRNRKCWHQGPSWAATNYLFPELFCKCYKYTK